MQDLSRAEPALEADRVLCGAAVPAMSAGAGPPAVVLPDARADGRGIFYRRGDRLFLLPWRCIEAAHAAEVGEPEGVLTVVFDLAVSGAPGGRCRLDADPGEPARGLGQSIERAIGRGRCTASLRAVALEGYATRTYPDLESFEADAPEGWRRSA